MKAIVGLTTYGRTEVDYQTEHYDQYFAIPAQYVDAVRRAGGIPVLLPPGETEWKQLLDQLDALIVVGGTDIAPAYYGGQADHPHVQQADAERDTFELELLREVAGQELPTLCICRGMQVLNVALGGTLVEHIPDIKEEDIHRNADGFWIDQAVAVKTGSSLEKVMNSAEVRTHSGHHQAIKDVANDLEVVATAPDGIIEALTLPSHPFLLAVQWHPEVTAAIDETQQRIFDQLVQAACP